MVHRRRAPLLVCMLIAATLLQPSCDAALAFVPSGCRNVYYDRTPPYPLANRGLSTAVIMGETSLPSYASGLFCPSGRASGATPASAVDAFFANVRAGGGVAATRAGGVLTMVTGNAAMRTLFSNLALSVTINSGATFPLVWLDFEHEGGSPRFTYPPVGPGVTRSIRVVDDCLNARLERIAGYHRGTYASIFAPSFHHLALVKWEVAAALVPRLAGEKQQAAAGQSDAPRPAALFIIDPDIVALRNPLPAVEDVLAPPPKEGKVEEEEEPPCDVYVQPELPFSGWWAANVTDVDNIHAGIAFPSPSSPGYSLLRALAREALNNAVWGVGTGYGVMNTGMMLWRGTPAAANLSAGALAFMRASLNYRGYGPGPDGEVKDPRAHSSKWHAIDVTALRPGHNLDDQSLFAIMMANMYRTQRELDALGVSDSSEEGEVVVPHPQLSLLHFMAEAKERRCVVLKRRRVGRPHLLQLPAGAGWGPRSLGAAGPPESARLPAPTTVPLWVPLEEEEVPGSSATAAVRAALEQLPSTVRLGILPPTRFSGRMAVEVTGICHAGEGEADAAPTLIHYNWLSGTARKAKVMARDAAWYLDSDDLPPPDAPED